MSLTRTKQSAELKIQFRRTGERRYAVTIHRSGQAPMEMNPAPGFDPLMPHDLLHFIVESELGLRHGIFGQIAEGGTAGTFISMAAAGESNREVGRSRRRANRRGDKLLREGRDDSAQSEHATYVCLQEWLARSADPARRKLAQPLAWNANQSGSQQTAEEAKVLNDSMVNRICARMDELSAQWSALAVGESLTVHWPNGR
ncbi:MAG: hypothetical protein JST85_30305 [Acidobacteria bacterium]|nr:hypothetical protein [Acidobacteriota bacterium]